MIIDQLELVLDNDLLELEGIDNARENIWLHYKDANDNPIPRVTHIIKQCTDQEYLIKWAARIGYNKYEMYREKALEVGTLVHFYIDLYLEAKYIKKDISLFKINYDEIGVAYRAAVHNGIESFIAWEKNLNQMGYFIEEVIGLEVPVRCPWFGGTVDAILRINGAVYLIDFKTSKQITTDYLIQAAAYMWMINNGYAPELPLIDGIGIIRVDKQSIRFNDLFLNCWKLDARNFVTRLIQTFLSYVESYYRTINSNFMFDCYNKTFYFQSDVPIENGGGYFINGN